MASSSSSSQPQQPARRHSSAFKERVGRKMAKAPETSRGRTELPDRFHDDDDDDENVDDGTGTGKDSAPFLAHQSLYGLMAATQSKVNFAGLFQQDSGSESDGDDVDALNEGSGHGKSPRSAKLQEKSTGGSRRDKQEVPKHGSKASEKKLVQSLLKPMKKKKEHLQQEDPLTHSQLLPPRDQHPQEKDQSPSRPTDAPILDRKLQAMAKAAMESSSSSLTSKTEGNEVSEDVVRQKASKSLPEVIANIFGFDEPEDVISEYPCLYTQNVLLQGFMYITQKHICFYSYLNKKTTTVLKEGHLGKLGKHSFRYRQYWFILKGDTLSYYQSSAEPYFPLSHVDLRYAISAEISAPETGKDATAFTITTPDRVYYYRADTSSSAKEWVKQLQRVIFRSHNEGDSVKLSLPLENVLDVEETNVFEFAETVKLRAMAGDDTFALDEYFFTFFKFGKDAIELLKTMTDGNGAKEAIGDDAMLSPLRNMRSPSDGLSPSAHSSPARFQEPVRWTLSPLSAGGAASARAGREQGKRSTSPRGGRSGSLNDPKRRSSSPQSPLMQESTDSFATSSQQAASISTLDEAINPDMSASQMLTDEGMFARPTFKMPQPRRTGSGTTGGHLQQESQQSSRESSTDRARVQPPPRQATGQTVGDDRAQAAGDGTTTQPVDIKGPGRLVRGISTPFQHAITVADMVRSSSKRMSSYLSSSPKTYISNITDAWAGGKRHYTDVEGSAPDDSVRDLEQDVDVEKDERRFREHFGLPPTEKLLSVFFCWLHRTIPVYGKIYMSTSRFCFRSLIYGVKTKLIIPYHKVLNVQKQRGFRWGYPGMILVLSGYEELFFDFNTRDLRDDAVATLFRNVDTGFGPAAQSVILTAEERQLAAAAAAENESLVQARKDGYADIDIQLPQSLDSAPPILVDDPADSNLDVKPKKSLRIVCMTIGSRGDVQPFIALCKGLKADGHRPKIATHLEFKDWILKHGIEFAEVAGNPSELIRICVVNGMFTPSFLLDAHANFRGFLDELCDTGLTACQDADVLIESPVAMVGIHIAEAKQIPYLRAFGMPWTRTRAYPQAFAMRGGPSGGAYNYMSYTLLDNVMWTFSSWQINRWRRDSLGLPPTSLGKLDVNKIPFLYNYSPYVVVPPLDYNDWIKVTGYWFLNEGGDFKPPEELTNFIKKARDDKKKLVYVGFGSVTVENSRLTTENIRDAILKADVRCILSKGWSDRLTKEEPNAVPIELPDCIHQIDTAPHDWLFKQIDVAVHHGGAGTTGASLRAGVPTLIKPWFGDQYFFAKRVEDLGVGMHLTNIRPGYLSRAIRLAANEGRLRQKAAVLGEKIRAENGVETAIRALYSHMNYAEYLIKKKQSKEKQGDGQVDSAEENWTFVDGDSLEEAPVPDDEDDKEDDSDDDDDSAVEEESLSRKEVKGGKKKAEA